MPAVRALAPDVCVEAPGVCVGTQAHGRGRASAQTRHPTHTHRELQRERERVSLIQGVFTPSVLSGHHNELVSYCSLEYMLPVVTDMRDLLYSLFPVSNKPLQGHRLRNNPTCSKHFLLHHAIIISAAFKRMRRMWIQLKDMMNKDSSFHPSEKS